MGTGGYGLNYYAYLFLSIEKHGSSGIFPATLGGAKIMGLDQNIGSPITGKLADIITLDLCVLGARIHADRQDRGTTLLGNVGKPWTGWAQ